MLVKVVLLRWMHIGIYFGLLIFLLILWLLILLLCFLFINFCLRTGSDNDNDRYNNNDSNSNNNDNSNGSGSCGLVVTHIPLHILSVDVVSTILLLNYRRPIDPERTTSEKQFVYVALQEKLSTHATWFCIVVIICWSWCFQICFISTLKIEDDSPFDEHLQLNGVAQQPRWTFHSC